MVNNMKTLQTISLPELTNWSVRYLLDFSFNYNEDFDLMPIGQFLTRNRNLVNIRDDETYQRVTVRAKNKGVCLRDTEIGKKIGTKKQYKVSKGQFIISKIDARNGAMGLIPDDLDGAIVTNDFPTFVVDNNRINSQFLLLLTTTKTFIKFAQSCSSGTTNRQRINIEQFLNIKIPLPSLKEQDRIVANYNTKTQLAKQQEKQAKNLEINIENYLFEVLGIEKLVEKENKKGLQIVHLKNLDRWDILAKDLRTLNGLSTSKYELKKLGDAFSFPSKSWKKKEYKEEHFKYIELGAIDTNFGITKVKNIEVKKAPSRATQQVNTGDLIIGTTRPYLKRFAIVEKQFEGNICSSGFSVIEPNSNYNLNYLKEFLMSFYGIEQLKNRMTGGTYPAITNSELKEILIPFPNPTIQNKIGTHIANLKQQIQYLKNQAEQNKIKAIKDFEEEIFITD